MQLLSSASSQSLICVGQIVGVHGLRGHIKVKSFTQDPRRLFTFLGLYDQHKQQKFQFEKALSQEGGLFVARLSGIGSRSEAEVLRGEKLFIEREELPDMVDEDTFYHADLVGLRVIDEEGQGLGNIEGVHNFGAGDILQIRKRAITRWVPFTRDFVPEVCVQDGFMRVKARLLSSFEVFVEEEKKG